VYPIKDIITYNPEGPDELIDTLWNYIAASRSYPNTPCKSLTCPHL